MIRCQNSFRQSLRRSGLVRQKLYSLRYLSSMAGESKDGAGGIVVNDPRKSIAVVQEIMKSHECFNNLFIGGKFVKAGDEKTIPAIYPAIGAEFHRFPDGKPEDVGRAVAAAKSAWDDGKGTWAKLTATERGECVKKVAAKIGEFREKLAMIEAADVGKPFRQSNMTLGGAVGEGNYFSNLGKILDAEQNKQLAHDEYFSLPDKFKDLGYRRDPIGVVALISAWNYPMNVAFRKVAPALVAGNSIVLKPSENACLSVMFIAQAVKEAGIPDGVFNLVTGGPDAGAALASHPDVSFTGSSTTGGKVMQSCGPNLTKPHLELGGKSALVVCDDADVDVAIETCLKGFLTNGGQICTAHTRLIAHESIKDKIVDGLVQHLSTVEFCTDPITEKDRGDRAWEGGRTDVIQPLVCEKQHQMVLGYLERAAADGFQNKCTKLALPAEGYFVQPTIFDNVARDHDLWQKEVFGPVLCVSAFSTDEEAVELVNSTKFGLASTVLTTNKQRGQNIGNQIRAGTVFVTSTGDGILAEFPGVQRGGYGLSGVGRELGLDGLFEFTELKSVGCVGFDN